MAPDQITRKMTIGGALRSVALRFPNRIALVDGDERVTYRQLVERARILAGNLHDLGVEKGARIATLLWSQVEFIYLFFAAAERGAVIAPLPPRLRRHQLETFLRELEPTLIVTSSELDVRDGLQVLADLQGEIPTLQRILLTDMPNEGCVDFKELLSGQSDQEFVDEVVQPQDLLAILYTSGTTSRGKGVMHNHRSLISPVVASIKLREMWMMRLPTPRLVRRWLRVLFRYGMRLLRAAGRQQIFLSTMGMHTISGLEAMLQALLMGDRFVLLPRFHPVKALEMIERERVSVFIGMPVAYATMMRARDFDHYRLSSLLICATGAAPCPPVLAREIQERFHCGVHIGFGMTELGGGIAASSLEDAPSRQAETVGRPMPGMEVRIVDDARRPLPTGAIGELACRSDGMTLGYFGDRQDLSEMTDEERWLYTGDMAMIDEEGYLHIVGRKKDMIIRGGQNIYPARIESHLAAMDEVSEAAVVGVPNELGGESVWAFVIPNDEVSFSEKDVLAHCRSHLEVYEIPERVRIVSDFPRTSNGKPQKYKLRQMARKEG